LKIGDYALEMFSGYFSLIILPASNSSSEKGTVRISVLSPRVLQYFAENIELDFWVTASSEIIC
jgi:hypothetical protein